MSNISRYGTFNPLQSDASAADKLRILGSTVASQIGSGPIIRVGRHASATCNMSTFRQSTEQNRHLQAATERQRHRSEALCRVIDEREIVRIRRTLILPSGVITDHDRSRSQMRSNKFDRRSDHRYPDIHQHEVDRPLDLTKCLAQIALSQIDETAQTGFAEMRSCGASLLGLVFGADHHTAASASTDIVAHGSG